MQKGITIYPGLDNTPEENLDLLERAAAYGFQQVLLILLLPYADRLRAKGELPGLIKVARKLHLETIAALTPEVMDILHINRLQFSAFQFMGISALYLKGYPLEALAELSRNGHGINIQFNASDLTEEDIQLLLDQNPNLSQLEALHDIYPRVGSGLSEENLIQKTVLLHRAGIKVGAFLPSSGRKRCPFGEGLPSMEVHRYFSSDLAARHYAAIGMDSLFFADSLPEEAEMENLMRLPQKDIWLRAEICTEDRASLDLLNRTYTARMDEARDFVRATESMAVLRAAGFSLKPENTVARSLGDVTIDNDTCQGFAGELNIVKRPAPASRRTNVVAKVKEEETFLINYIMPGRKFKLMVEG